MTHEICCQCENPTGRAGRGEDSLYTDNDWGPYCVGCWEDADYWRCLAEENNLMVERLRETNAELLEALEALVKSTDYGAEDDRPLMRTARAAIAKAKIV